MSPISASNPDRLSRVASAASHFRAFASLPLRPIVFLIFLVALAAPGRGEDIRPGRYQGIYHVDRWGQHRFGFQFVAMELHDQLKEVAGRPIEVNATQIDQPMNPGGSRISKIEGIERFAEPVEITVRWLRPKDGPTEILRQVQPGSTVRLQAKVTNRSDQELVLNSDAFALALDAHLSPSPTFGSHHVSYPLVPRQGRIWIYCRDRLPLLPENQELNVFHPHVIQPKYPLTDPPRLAPGKSLELTITLSGWWPNEFELGVLYRVPQLRGERRAPFEVASNLLRLDVLTDDSSARRGRQAATVDLQISNGVPADASKPISLRIVFTNTLRKRLRIGFFRGPNGPDLSAALLCFDREGTLLPITPGDRMGTEDIRLEPGKSLEVPILAPAGTVMARVAFQHPLYFKDKREDERSLDYTTIYSPTLRITPGAMDVQPPPVAVARPLGEAHAALLDRLMDEGSAPALLELTHDLTVAEISQAIGSLPAELAPLTSGADPPTHHVLHQAQDRFYHQPILAVDSQGVTHLVFQRFFQQFWPNRQGNSSGAVFHAERENGQWSPPAPFVDDPLGSTGTRLLIDRRDCLYVIGALDRESQKLDGNGNPKSSWDVVLCRREPGQPWSDPESCMTGERLEALPDPDACFDPEGRLHLAWAHRISNQDLHRLRHRVRGPDGWGEATVLPGINRNLGHARLRLLGGQLHVFAAGQTTDYKQIGAYHGVLGDAGWTEPELLVDDSDFNHVISPPSDRFLLGVHAGNPLWERTFRLFRAGEDGRLTQFAQFLIPGYGSLNWATLSIAWGPLDVAYGLTAQSGNMYLVRIGNSGDTEAVWLSSSPDEADVVDPRLLIAGERYQATWILRDRGQFTVYTCEAPIPAGGWLPIEKLLWRSRRGVGLTTADQQFLSELVYREATPLEVNDLRRAINRYFYVIANFQSREAFLSRDRVLELEKDHFDLLKAELRALLQQHPEYLAGELLARRTLNELTTRWDVVVE